MLFIIVLFVQFKGSKGNLFSFNEVYTIEEQKKIFDLDKVKKDPYILTTYLKELFHNSRINTILFEQNIDKIKQKIYSIINNKESNKDIYNILSSIYGAFLADAMGGNTEFLPKDPTNHLKIYHKNEGDRFEPGQITDDSEMAMAQSFGILDNYEYKSINEHLIYYYYVAWYDSDPLDMGSTTRNALTLTAFNRLNIDSKTIFTPNFKYAVKVLNANSKANGFLMRASPFLTWFHMTKKDYIKEILLTKSNDKYLELFNQIYNEFSKDILLTHPNEENIISGSIMIFMGLCSLQQDYTGKEILEMTKILLNNPNFQKDVGKEVKQFFETSLNDFEVPNFSKFDYFEVYEKMGFYRHAFKLTLYYLSIIDEAKDLKDFYTNMIYDISDFGGDTDTNGAIVGMILGPLIGMENFDKKYFDVFLSFYDKDRIIFTNSFMYYYAVYLKSIENSKKRIERRESKVNYFFIENFIKMINEKIRL